MHFNHATGCEVVSLHCEGSYVRAVLNNDTNNQVLSAGGEQGAGSTAFFENTANCNSFYYVLRSLTGTIISNANTTIQGILVKGAQVRTFGNVPQRVPSTPISLFHNESGTVASPASTSYTTVISNSTTKIDFDKYRPLYARVVGVVQGNEAGSGKGIEIRNVTAGAQLCEATWNGNTKQAPVVGAWTDMTTTTDSTLTVRATGSSATETITIYHLELQFH